ncbi:hypothetical protein TrispH2_000335 [Trichoplax sp. H2]|nr:hypothetical protein TrispH2_000335 [Trichoplax sp. H2]|eukprot:RDD47460.1 hypothetical protein TrispH2_000335 [Trichoplax sp. H2]
MAKITILLVLFVFFLTLIDAHQSDDFPPINLLPLESKRNVERSFERILRAKLGAAARFVRTEEIASALASKFTVDLMTRDDNQLSVSKMPFKRYS